MCQLIKLLVFLILFAVIAGVNYKDNDDKTLNNGEIFLKSFDDVQIEEKGNDTCAPFSPTLPDFWVPGRSVSEVKCFEHVWRAKLGMINLMRLIQCDRKRSGVHRLLGGRSTKLSDFAHMGALGWRAVIGTWIFKCGGSLISSKFVLTAAHCASAPVDTTVMDNDPKIVRLGVVTLNKNNLEFSKHLNLPTDVNIKRIIKHPLYHSPRRYYDIALIELEKEIEFQWILHPACLHTSSDLPTTVTVTGWGVINLATLKTAPSLQVGDLTVIESSKCDDLLESKRNRHWDGVAEHQMCAGHMAGGVDTCQGDSGGPLQYLIDEDLGPNRDSLRWTVHRVVGITSFSYGCGEANTPGVYTRVASFTEWIESIVWPDDSISSRIVFPNQ